MEVKVKTQDNNFTLKGKVNNNEVFIKNAFEYKYIAVGMVEAYV